MSSEYQVIKCVIISALFFICWSRALEKKIISCMNNWIVLYLLAKKGNRNDTHLRFFIGQK